MKRQEIAKSEAAGGRRGAGWGVLFAGLVLTLLAPPASRAQQVKATLLGTVTDPAGAAVPDATVIAVDPQTGFTASAKTQTDGSYVIPALPPADYTVTVEKTGFDKSVQTGVTLVVNQQARLDLQLKVGTIATTVEVAGHAELVETSSATVGLTIDTRQVTELPLNIRRFGQLPLLMPGTVPDRGGFSSNIFGSPFSEVTYASNGSRGSGNNVLIDGIDSQNLFSGGFSVQPSPDAVQEFTFQTESFSAVFGKRAGSTLNLVTRSGTNEFHGSAFEFLRNSNMDARNFFTYNQTDPLTRQQIPGSARPEYRRNQFGGYVGGPIKKNKMFIFGGYEALRERKGLPALDTVPTPQMLGGNFSQLLTGNITLSPCPNPRAGDPMFDTGAIFDPTTFRQITCSNGTVVNAGNQFLGNIILPARFDAVAQKVIPYFPAPNLPGIVNNYEINNLRRRRDDQFLVKYDYNINDKDKLFVRYILADSVTYTTEQAYTTLPGFNDRIRFRGQNAALAWTHTFGPTLLNEVRIGFSRNMDIGTCANCPRAPGFMASFGIPGLKALSPQQEGFPFFGFAQGYAGVGDANYRPVESNDMVEKFYDAITLIKGKHTFTAGADMEPYQSFRDQAPFSPHGQFSYGGLYTNFTISDFLLGYPNSAGRSVTDAVNEHLGGFWNAFAQDDYRVTQKLTFNVGLRWEYHQMPVDRGNIGAVLFRIPGASLFTPGNALLVVPDYAQADALCNQPRYIDPQGNRLLACSSDMKKYGFTGRIARSLWFPDRFNWAPRFGFAWRPTSSDRLVVRAGYGLFFDFPDFNILHYGFNNPIQGISQFNNVQSGTWLTPPISTADAFTTATIPALKDSFLSLNPDPHFRQSYVNEWDFDIESQLTSALALEVRYLGTSAIELTHFHFFGNQAVPGPGSIQPRRLYPDFGFTAEGGPGSNANYNSLQLQLTKKMSQGLNLLAGFTWAKQLTNNEGEEGGYADGGAPLGQDDNHQGPEYARGVNDVKYRFTFSSLYELPFGRGRHFGSQAGRLLNGFLGGWQLNSILSLQTGFPETPQAGQDVANVGTGSPRPDRVCNGNQPDSKRSVAQWFNTSCFTLASLLADAAAGRPRFGNSGRSVIEGPGIADVDLGLIKDFPLGERTKLQFRGEFFNAFNHPNFGDPVMNLSAGNYGQLVGAAEPRDIQFALKLTW